ncbi:M23 family metallopeptidase [Paenibacillus koleovorans]|uniref:M23 family metallopeptidase n=1 Tax=Paenibacillus koleovorans TaxID=121608 RepID=UPI000FD9E58E|nr:M23 family metallopeptidase [Paenibacillus koleovorans]
MSDQNKETQVKQSAPKTNTGAETVKLSTWKRLTAKKWVFPATYMAAAAIILTLMWVYQDGGTQPTSDSTGVEVSKTQPDASKNPDAVAVGATAETLQWPVKSVGDVDVLMNFFDSKASNEVRQAAMIEYGDTLTPHMGIDLGRDDDKTFEVAAAAGGKVTRVETDPLVGQLVEITHSNGIVTIYQSLADVKVAKDAQVKKGDVIASAGRSELEKEMGYHIHFEVRQDGTPVNPETLLGQKH